MMGYGMMGYGFGFMLLWWLVIIAGITFAVYGIIQMVRGKKGIQNDAGDKALEQLKLRFATGEITKEEYLERKQVLEQK